MRKRVVGSMTDTSARTAAEPSWLDLDTLAEVEVSSEAEGFPIEAALLAGQQQGWRAADPGPQTIRLRFDQPQRLSRIWVWFEEKQFTRTQEFVLRSSADGGKSFRDIVRQQWNFAGADSPREEESYTVDLPGVTALELTITPDISGGAARASLLRLRVS